MTFRYLHSLSPAIVMTTTLCAELRPRFTKRSNRFQTSRRFASSAGFAAKCGSRWMSRNSPHTGLTPAPWPRCSIRATAIFRSATTLHKNQEYVVETGTFLASVDEVGQVVVGVHEGHPVYLRDVASVEDGSEEPANYVLYGEGQKVQPAVTISIAKRKGANAIDVADQVIRKVDSLKSTMIPGEVGVHVTRNYGETAAEKSNELLLHMMLAIVSVSVLIWLTLGRRESGIVALAIPVTLALTLVVFYLYGYTLNRVTLFALIFSIGILVDDAIVVVENIVRHYRLPENKDRSVYDVAVEAVDEVGNPTILATFAVIAAIVPMAFVRGLMGPYMRPIPVGASAAMVFSLLVAFVVTPWASVRLLRRDRAGEHTKESFSTRAYRRIMSPLLHNAAASLWLSGIGRCPLDRSILARGVPHRASEDASL